MRLALVAACLLAVVAVTISPSSGHPAPGVRTGIKVFLETIKKFADKKVDFIKDRFKDVFRGRRDVDSESHGTSDNDLRAISDLVSALEDASDILSSIEDVYNIIEGGSFEDDMNDLEDSDDDNAAEDLEKEDGEAVDNGDGENGDKRDEENRVKGDDVREEAKDGTVRDVDEVNGRV